MGVFDLEIETAVEDHPDGWAAARRGDCGMSCAVVYDSATLRPHIYDIHTLDKLIEHIRAVDVLVTFNGMNFDLPCISGLHGEVVCPTSHYDILYEINRKRAKRSKGWGLGNLAEINLNKHKTGSGERAPQLYKENRWAELVDYCIADVYLTRDLYNHIGLYGCVVGPENEAVALETPWGDLV